uniref:Polycomb group protein ASXL1 isoform X2 n=1 Tax=Geotrypetes seraphini TaxID=260995 RepID=A0A6P8SJ11_GEOSA|nr:polycomb group protein ASXL1 isoform X2 [Geotrypetes seraphini]
MKDKQKRKKERTWAEAARMVLENYSDAPMTPKQILQVIEAEGLKEMSGASPLACLNAMLHSNSRGADAVFYKLPGRISLFTLKDALPWSRSLSMPQIDDELDDAVDGESCESTEASTMSGGDNDGSPDETSSNASCSTESQSQILPSTRACSRQLSQTSKLKKKTEVMLPRVVLTPLKVNGTQVESASAFTGIHADGMSSTSSINYNVLPMCSSSLLSSTPLPHLQSIKKTSGGQVKRSRVEEIDFETPGSILVNTNLRALLNLRNFSILPSHCQQQLLLLLPEVDRQIGNDGQLRLSSNALNNEFFTHAAQSWQERLADGEFTHEMQVRLRQEMEKEKKVEAWKGKFFEDYYGQKLGLTKEEMQHPSDDTENVSELCIEAEALRHSHASSGRLREDHFMKYSWPELGSKAGKNLDKVEKSEESETLADQIYFRLDNAQPKESKEEFCSSSCLKSAVPKFENSDILKRSSHELERLAITSSSFECGCNISCISQENLKLESKDQKRGCFEQTASSSFPEKKPRLEDRQSFRNTIKSVYTEKLQPTKEEPRVPPIRIQLSRIKPPWVVKGQPAYQMYPRIISNHKPTRWGQTGARTFTNIKAETQTGAAASTIGGGDGSGGGGSTNGGGGLQQFSNLTKTGASKRTYGTCEPNFKRTQLLSSYCIATEKTNRRTIIKPLKINWTVHENHYSVNEDKFTLGKATSLVELRVETNTDVLFIVLFVTSQLFASREISGKENEVAKEIYNPETLSSFLLTSRYPSMPDTVSQEEQVHYITVTINQGSIYNCYINGRSISSLVGHISVVSTKKKISTFKHSHIFYGKYASLVGCTGFATIFGSMPDTKHWEPFNEVQLTEFDFTAVVYLAIKDSIANDNDGDDAILTKILKNWPKCDCKEKMVPANVQIRKRNAGAFQMESSSLYYVINTVSIWDVTDTSKDFVLQFEDSPLEEGKCVSQQVLREMSRHGCLETWGMANDTMDSPSGNVAVDVCYETSDLKNPIRNIVNVNHFKPFIQIDEMKQACLVHLTQLVSMRILENREESLRWMINLFIPQRIVNPLNHTNTANQPKSAHSVKLCSSVESRSPLFAPFLQGSLYPDNVLPQISSRTRQEMPPFSLCLAVDSYSVKNKRHNSGTRVKVPSWGLGQANKCNFGGIHLDLYCCLQSSTDSAQKNYYDVIKVFLELEGFMNQSGVSGIIPHISSSLCSQELLLCSFNFEVQEIFSPPLACIQQLPYDREKGKSPVNAGELTISSGVPLSITSIPNLSSETSIDKSYSVILEEKIITMVYSGSTSSPAFNKEVSQSVQETVSCPTKQVLSGSRLVCQKEGQPTQEELLLKPYLNCLDSRKSKVIPGCQGSVQINMVSWKEMIDEIFKLRENFQSMPLILNLPLFKRSRSTAKKLQHPLSPSFVLKMNIKEILYRKLWKLHLNSTGYNYAADNPVERFHKNFAWSVKELGHKAKFTATNAPYSVQVFVKNSGVKQISMQSSCILKVMIVCIRCGAFCHNNCIGPSKLCVSLMVR